VKVPFYGPRLDTIRRLGNDHVFEILEVLPDEEIRFKNLQQLLQNAYNHRLQVNTLAESLLEAEWLGCVRSRMTNMRQNTGTCEGS